MSRYNVFVLGMDEFNQRKLERLPIAEQCRFIGLLDPTEILEAEYFPIDDMLARAEAQIAAFDEQPDAIIGYVDFPVSTMLPVLAGRFGLRSTSLESLLKCEHKYWSRRVQREVVPEHIPPFEWVDPFGDDPVGKCGIAYPFWLKPVKSAGSYLGFRIDNTAQFEEALDEIRAHIGIFAEPFDRILERAELPDEIAAVGGHFCLAESLMAGRQCTLEGYVYDREIHFHGLIDSIRAKGRPTFLRYQYPSRLPRRAREQMEDVSRRLLTHIGFNQSAFNTEFFWDAARDTAWLLEINTRVAQHHADLFEKVNGVSNHEAAVNVALGRRPQFPEDGGHFKYAACCFLRAYQDGIVGRLPSADDIAALAAEVPGIIFEPHVQPGTRLSTLSHQETYSYALALVYLGGNDLEQIRARYRLCRERLDFDIRAVDSRQQAESQK